MNNSFISENVSLAEYEKPDNKPALRVRETELSSIIEAIVNLANNPDYQVLQAKIFNGLVEGLNKRLMVEVKKKPLNGPLIHSLNGQIEVATKYSDILSLASIYKLELQNTRKVLNAKDSGDSSTNVPGAS